MVIAAIIPLILQGLTILPSIIQAFQVVFKSSTATSKEKSEALTAVAGTVINAVGSVSAGGQKETMDKAAQVLPMFQKLTENLMELAESSGKPGAEKQGYVTGIVTSALQGWEQLSTGGQAATVEQIKPVVMASIDTLVPILFPKDESKIENLQPSG
jgi:hypothetical protein